MQAILGCKCIGSICILEGKARRRRWKLSFVSVSSWSMTRTVVTTLFYPLDFCLHEDWATITQWWTWAGNSAGSQGLFIQLELYNNCPIHRFWVGKPVFLGILCHSHERISLDIAWLFCLVRIRISSIPFTDKQDNAVSYLILYYLCWDRSAKEISVNGKISGFLILKNVTAKWFDNQFPDQRVSNFCMGFTKQKHVHI